MKFFCLAALFLFLSSVGFCQGGRIFKSKFSKKEAYIFDEKYPHVLIIPAEANRFTPNESEIEIVEATINDSIPLKKYYRQYVGYYKNGDKILLVNLLRRKEKNYSLSEFLLGFGPYYERNQRIIYINISKNSYSNP